MKRIFSTTRTKAQAALLGVSFVLALLLHLSVCVSFDNHDTLTTARAADRSVVLLSQEARCGFLGTATGCGKNNASLVASPAALTPKETRTPRCVVTIHNADIFCEDVDGRNNALAHKKLTVFLI